MTDLIDEVRTSFQKSKENLPGGESGFVLVQGEETELAAGFSQMRTYYQLRLMALIRRAYRHYAGSEMPTRGSELVDCTVPYLSKPMISVALGAFSDGVMVGQRSEHVVRMCLHFGTMEHLFHDEDFRELSRKMTLGFTEDAEVTRYFVTYLTEALISMAHTTGFAHNEVDPAKIWDIWILVGTACVTASYLAGNNLGASWRERDVLDGIEIASEFEGEDIPDH